MTTLSLTKQKIGISTTEYVFLPVRGRHLVNMRNQRRMLEESEKMIVDATTRLGKAVQDLRQLIVCPPHCAFREGDPTLIQITAQKDPGLADDEQLLKAEEELATATL